MGMVGAPFHGSLEHLGFRLNRCVGAETVSTLFTKIINGELPSDKVYEDDQVCAFRDINPAAPTHILIVPRKEVATVDDLADDDGALVGKMILVARDLARSEGIADSGYRIIINCKDEGGQEVPHLHLHLMGGRPMGPMVVRT